MGLTAPRPMVEILGVAGAGKTTLVDVICQSNSRTRRAGFIHTRNPKHLAHLVWSIPRLLPMLALNLFRAPRLTWREFKLFAYVSQWSKVLWSSRQDDELLLLDQGPLYCLVRLQALGKGVTRTPWFDRFKAEMARKWSDELGAVIFLDANDDTLVSRIKQRAQDHATKNRDTEEARAFVVRYRDLFGEILELLPDSGGPEVLRFDSGDSSPEEIAARVQSKLASLFTPQGRAQRPGAAP